MCLNLCCFLLWKRNRWMGFQVLFLPIVQRSQIILLFNCELCNQNLETMWKKDHFHSASGWIDDTVVVLFHYTLKRFCVLTDLLKYSIIFVEPYVPSQVYKGSLSGIVQTDCKPSSGVTALVSIKTLWFLIKCSHHPTIHFVYMCTPLYSLCTCMYSRPL